MSQQDDSAEKVHDPTPRKLDQARRKGELPRSADLNHAAGYAGLLAALVVFGAGGITSFGSGLMTLLDRPAELAAQSMQGGGPLLGGIVMHSLSGLIPWFAGPALAVLAVIAAQRGFVVAPDKIKPRMSRIAPIYNARNKYGRAGLFEFFKSFVKLCLYSACLGFFLTAHHAEMANAAAVPPSQGITILARLSLRFLFVVVLLAAALGLIDLLWQRSEHMRRNRMTDRELRDEIKDSEGDPHLKQERRQRAQGIALNQMMAEVPRADVVIVNPTHFAVALAWARTPGTAPVVVAKGADETARRIREVALASQVPVHSDPPTARALYREARVGSEIAPAHYRAVAAAIRFADMLKRKRRARGAS